MRGGGGAKHRHGCGGDGVRSGSALCLGFIFSSGPRLSLSLWVLAGDYILGSEIGVGAGPGHSRRPLLQVHNTVT